MSRHKTRDLSKKTSVDKDYFDKSGSIKNEILLPENLKYLTLGKQRLMIPTCFIGSVFMKAAQYHLTHTDLGEGTANKYFMTYRNVFKILKEEPIRGREQVLQQATNAIKKFRSVTDVSAKEHQKRLVAALNKVIGNLNFSRDEQKEAHEILRNYTPFQDPRKNTQKRPSLSVFFHDLPYTDADYINSIRTFAFLHFVIWTRIRDSFRSLMPSEHAELLEILSNNPDFGQQICHGTDWPASFNGSKLLKQPLIRIREIIYSSVRRLNDPCLTEAVFLSLVYNHPTLEPLYLESFGNQIGLKSDIDHEKMKEVISLFTFPDGRAKLASLSFNLVASRCAIQPNNLSFKKISHRSLFSPLQLLFPQGDDEMGVYLCLLLSDRLAPFSFKDIRASDLKFMDSSMIETDEGTASRVTFSGTVKIYKGRSGKKYEIPTYKRGSTYFDILKAIKSSRQEMIKLGLALESDDLIFNGLIGNNSSYKGFLAKTLGQQNLAKSTLCPAVIKGTRYYELLERQGHMSFIELMVAASQRLTGSSNGATNKNPDLPPWQGQNFITPTMISASREEADNAEGLKDSKVSEDMDITLTRSFYDKLDIEAEQQGHGPEQRRNTYFSRARSKAVIQQREKFAAAVGEEMVIIAEEILALFERTSEVIDIAAAKQLCGLGDVEGECTAEELMTQADAIGFLVNDAGFVKTANNAITYIIKSDINALLMIAKMEHLDKGIDELLYSNDGLVPKAIAIRMYIAALLEKFEDSMVIRAKSRWEKLKFMGDKNPISFPSLVTSLGEY